MAKTAAADPPRFPPDVAQELFYVDADGNRQDAGFHNEILDQGDFEAAKRVSDRIKAEILAKARKAEKAWDESAHPREPAGGPGGGQFAGGGGGGSDGAIGERPKVERGQSVSADVVKSVEAAVAAIPASHAEKIKHVPIYTVHTMNDVADVVGEGAQHAAGTYSWYEGKSRIYVPELHRIKFQLPGKPMKQVDVPFKNISQTATHEMGHALDHANDWKLSDVFFKDVGKFADVVVTPEEAQNAQYWTGSRREMFAELYALAYDPSKDATYFGGMSRERAESVYATALKIVKDIK